MARKGPLVRSRLLLGLAVLMMLAPSFLYWAGPLRRPLMVAGDRLEEQACPVCQGTGPKCKRCHGKGVISFIVAGPNRPTHIIGHVYGNDQVPVASAQVTILTPAEPISLRTDPQGRFGATLPPGNYTVVLQAQGRPEVRHSLSVERITRPAPADQQVTFPTRDQAFSL